MIAKVRVDPEPKCGVTRYVRTDPVADAPVGGEGVVGVVGKFALVEIDLALMGRREWKEVKGDEIR